MSNVFNFPKQTDRNLPQDHWTMLEEVSVNGRSMIAWKIDRLGTYHLCMFNFDEQPNELSKQSPETNWGYLTYAIDGGKDQKAFFEAIDLYLEDMVKGDYWWEKDQ